MMTNISWSQYFLAIGLLSAVYYAYVFIRYRNKGQETDEQASQWQEDADELNGRQLHDAQEINDELFAQADELIEKISMNVEVSETKEEFSRKIKDDLLEYPALNIPAFRAGINNRIITELEKKGSIKMSEREVEGLW